MANAASIVSSASARHSLTRGSHQQGMERENGLNRSLGRTRKRISEYSVILLHFAPACPLQQHGCAFPCVLVKNGCFFLSLGYWNDFSTLVLSFHGLWLRLKAQGCRVASRCGYLRRRTLLVKSQAQEGQFRSYRSVLLRLEYYSIFHRDFLVNFSP